MRSTGRSSTVELPGSPGDPAADQGRRSEGAAVDPAGGSAVVEFALVSVIALTVALALVQLALFMWQRNVVMTALSEGARVAATSGRGAAAGRQAACALLDQTLGNGCARVTVNAVEQDGVVVVTGTGKLPSF